MSKNVKYGLEEKKAYIFDVLKIIESENNEKFYIIVDPNGKKHLMPSKYYKNYNINVGDKIKCYIDKINCVGKLFFEPEHPYYKRNNIYKFKFLYSDNGENKHSSSIFNINVYDIYNNVCTIVEKDNKNELLYGDIVYCKLDRIKKGHLYLSLASKID